MRIGYLNFWMLFLLVIIYAVFWVLGAIGTMRLAKKAGIKDIWLAWVPGLDQYLFIKLAGEKRRKLGITYVFLLILSLIIPMILSMAFSYSSLTLRGQAAIPVYGTLGIIALICSITLAVAMVLRYILLYRIFKRFRHSTATVFLVLSILFKFLEPIFLIVTSFNNSAYVQEDTTTEKC